MKINEMHVFVVLPLMLLWVGSTNCHSQSSAELRASSALANQFETVVYTRSQILTSSVSSNSSVVDAKNELALPFVELIAALRNLGPNAEADLETNYSAVLVGAADFAGPVGLGPGPEGLGMVNSRKCYIAVLGTGGDPDLDRDFKNASSESVGGISAWTWTIPSEGGASKPATFYAAQIGGQYLVMANNQPDFQAASSALTSIQGSTGSPINVPGWRTFSSYSYWAYRQFRRAGVHSPDASGLTGLGSAVSALVFFADVGQREGFVQVFSTNVGLQSAPPVLKKIGPESFQSQGGGVWQAKVPLSRDEAGVNAMFELFYRLGFGVAV